MKKLLALAGSFALVFATFTPASAAEYTVNQKTLSAFAASATALTSAQKAQVKAAVDANPLAEKFICTGIRFASQPMSENIKVRARAKAACAYAKELNPALSTFFQNKPTNARSYAGKVLLTVKSPLQGFEKAVSDIRSYRGSALSGTGLSSIEVFSDASARKSVVDHYANSVKRAAGFWAQFHSVNLVASVNVFSWGAKASMDSRSAALGIPGFGEDWWNRSELRGGGTVITDPEGLSHVFFRLNKEGGDFPSDDYAYHEVTHSYQYVLTSLSDFGGVPCWFPEGYAMVVGLANTFADSKTNLDRYRFERDARVKTMRDYFGAGSDPQSEQLKATLGLTHSDIRCNTQEPLFGYRLGMLVSEAWIAEFGFQKTIEFMKAVQGQDFSTQFERSFGVPLQTWLHGNALEYVSNAINAR